MMEYGKEIRLLLMDSLNVGISKRGDKFVCNQCGKIFELRSSFPAKYCSPECKRDWQNKNARLAKKGSPTRKSVYIPYKEEDVNRQWDDSELVECSWCGIKFAPVQRDNVSFCSDLCRKAYKMEYIQKHRRMHNRYKQSNRDFCKERGIKTERFED